MECIANTQEKRRLIIDGLYAFIFTPESIAHTRSGGIAASLWTVIEPWHNNFQEAMAYLGHLLEEVNQWKDEVTIACSAADIEQALSDGRFALIMSTQNADVIESDLSLLRVLHRLGVRILQPTYNEHNRLGDGATVPEDKGLTEFGRQWVHEMNRLHMVIDLSHAGHRTAADVIAESADPLIVGHTNAYALCKNQRNLPDELIRAVAEKGGVIGAAAYSVIVKRSSWPTIEDYLDHIAYIANLAGVAHVGFASDMYDGKTSREQWVKKFQPGGTAFYPTLLHGMDWLTYDTRYPKGFEDITRTPRIWDGLRARGYSEDDVEKIMGGNLLRVFREVWGE